MVKPKSRKILVAVSGMSPQIITETLYALYRERQWVPDEVHLVTTSEGRKNAVLQLLHDDGYFHRLLRDYKITKPIRFDESTIYVIRDANGVELRDLRTPEDNEAAADCICEIIRKLTEMPDTQLHVSLAGGRKTMGFYAGYALSLFGRPQDSLSHVLVSEHYESKCNFFYPAPATEVIDERDGEPLDAHLAQVWLADISFVRLRSQLPESLLEGRHSFSEAVRRARQATETVRLALYPQKCQYQVNDIAPGKLSPSTMALLLWAATRRLKGQPPITPVIEGEDRSADLQELRNIAEENWLSLNNKTEKHFDAEGFNQTWLEQTVSKLKSDLTKTLGPELAERCKLASRAIDGRGSYALPDDLIVEIISIDHSPQAIKKRLNSPSEES